MDVRQLCGEVWRAPVFLMRKALAVPFSGSFKTKGHLAKATSGWRRLIRILHVCMVVWLIFVCATPAHYYYYFSLSFSSSFPSPPPLPFLLPSSPPNSSPLPLPSPLSFLFFPSPSPSSSTSFLC